MKIRILLTLAIVTLLVMVNRSINFTLFNSQLINLEEVVKMEILLSKLQEVMFMTIFVAGSCVAIASIWLRYIRELLKD